MKQLTLLALVSLTAAAVSCAPTHPHHASASQPAIRGQLIDAGNGSPIGKTPMQLTVDGQPIKHTTNPDGKWRVPLAKINNNVSSAARITVDCPGYNHKVINWNRQSDRAAKDPGSINLGPIRMERR